MKFTKKPVTIEAIQWTGNNWSAFPNRMRMKMKMGQEGDKLQISTLEGTMAANIGDWIIEGIKGEIYPCKPDIFEATYDRETKNETHAGLPVHGYRKQHDDAVQRVNENKIDEERILRVIDSLYSADADQRWLGIAREHIELGFMALNRAIFQPGRVKLPEDDD